MGYVSCEAKGLAYKFARFWALPLKPQLGRTEALAEDLKQQVKRLAKDYREIAEVLRRV